MIEGHIILCISPTTWDSLWRNRQQVMSRLSEKNDVHFFEPQEKLSFRNCFRILTPGKVIGQSVKKLTIIKTPPALPFLGKLLPKVFLQYLTPAIVAINIYILARSINHYLRTFSQRKTILWIYNPLAYGLVDFCTHDILVYYVYDEVSLFPQNNRISHTIEALDIKLSLRANIIFASSDSQLRKRSPLNSNTILIQNTADFQHFHRAVTDNLSIPDDIREIKKPIIGCSGFLGFQIDAKLLLHLARHRPDWSIVLIGPDHLTKNETYTHLRSCHNVHFLGNKHYTYLPNYFRLFQIGLIPYNLSTHTPAAFPLRCSEYMASGVPVVSVSLDALKPLLDIVHMCHSYHDFVSQIDALLHSPGQEPLQLGIELVRNNSWDKRVEQISEAITQLSDSNTF